MNRCRDPLRKDHGLYHQNNYTMLDFVLCGFGTLLGVLYLDLIIKILEVSA